MTAIDELWVLRHRERLQRHYGAGTFVAVYEGAVIDWGDDEATVRRRAENMLGQSVFVGAVPTAAKTEIEADPEGSAVEQHHHAEAARANHRRRRFPISFDLFKKIGDLDITGRKTELIDGVVVIDGTERRFAEHDYRLMLESGLVSRDTELVAGVIFWKSSAPPNAAAEAREEPAQQEAPGV